MFIGEQLWPTKVVILRNLSHIMVFLSLGYKIRHLVKNGVTLARHSQLGALFCEPNKSRINLSPIDDVKFF